MGEMLARAGSADEAERAFATARAAFVELDLPVHVGYLALSTAIVDPLASDPAAAEAELRPAIEFFEESGAKHINASLVPLLASALVAQGRLDEALELIERTEGTAAPDDVDGQVRWRIARAQAMVTSNQLAEAEQFAREAVAAAEPGDTVVLTADANSALAEVLLAARSPSEAVPVLERALELYEAKGDVMSAARRRATLDALSGSRFL
jgi:tetratricopeptide (TPR) repeat protein